MFITKINNRSIKNLKGFYDVVKLTGVKSIAGVDFAPPPPLPPVVAGYNIWYQGWELYGILGNNASDTGKSFTVPTQLDSTNEWSFVEIGSHHSVGIKTDGTLWSWGQNNIGQLGLGDVGLEYSRSSPTRVGTDADWDFISAGQWFTAAIKTDGTLWSWGGNAAGTLGLNDTEFRSLPVRVGNDSDWAYVNVSPALTTDGGMMMAIKTDGTLWSWGFNALWGNLGHGDRVSRSVPTQVGGLNNWSMVGTGGHAAAVKTDGSLWTWGYNFRGQLGDGKSGSGTYKSSPVRVGSLNDWKSVSVGEYDHTMSIKTDGTLWSWGGSNSVGQLGTGNIIARSSPVRVGNDTDWDSVSAGYNCNLAIKTDGTLWAWGGNGTHGILGLGDTDNRSFPVQVGSYTDWRMAKIHTYHALSLR